MKENLKYIVQQLDANMITEDTLGNHTEFEEKDTAFSDQEDLNEKAKMTAIYDAIGMEIKQVSKELELIKYGISVAESGKEWVNTPYWMSVDGPIMITELRNDHLARIPRHLYNNGVVTCAADLPPNIVAEIKARGFTLRDDCIVLRENWVWDSMKGAT